MQITESGELDSLIISGNPNISDLQNSWNDIFNEYCDLSDSKNHIYLTQMTRDIAYISLKIDLIQQAVDALTFVYSPEIIEVMREWGYYYDFTPESMYDDLKNVVIQAKSLLVEKGVAEGKYKRYLEEQSKEEAGNFDETLTELSKFQGYHLNTKQLTVSEFCAIFNRYKKQAA